MVQVPSGCGKTQELLFGPGLGVKDLCGQQHRQPQTQNSQFDTHA